MDCGQAVWLAYARCPVLPLLPTDKPYLPALEQPSGHRARVGRSKDKGSPLFTVHSNPNGTVSQQAQTSMRGNRHQCTSAPACSCTPAGGHWSLQFAQPIVGWSSSLKNLSQVRCPVRMSCTEGVPTDLNCMCSYMAGSANTKGEISHGLGSGGSKCPQLSDTYSSNVRIRNSCPNCRWPSNIAAQYVVHACVPLAGETLCRLGKQPGRVATFQARHTPRCGASRLFASGLRRQSTATTHVFRGSTRDFLFSCPYVSSFPYCLAAVFLDWTSIKPLLWLAKASREFRTRSARRLRLPAIQDGRHALSHQGKETVSRADAAARPGSRFTQPR